MRLIDGDKLMEDLAVAITTQKSWMNSAKKSNSGTLFQLAQQAYFTLLECKQRLEKAPTVETPAQRWTPCSEGLPEVDGIDLLITDEDGRVLIARYDLEEWVSDPRPEFRTKAGYKVEPIAWMGFPKPYEEAHL